MKNEHHMKTRVYVKVSRVFSQMFCFPTADRTVGVSYNFHSGKRHVNIFNDMFLFQLELFVKVQNTVSHQLLSHVVNQHILPGNILKCLKFNSYIPSPCVSSSFSSLNSFLFMFLSVNGHLLLQKPRVSCRCFSSLVLCAIWHSILLCTKWSSSCSYLKFALFQAFISQLDNSHTFILLILVSDLIYPVPSSILWQKGIRNVTKSFI